MSADQLISDALAAHEASLAAQNLMQGEAVKRNYLIRKALDEGVGAVALAEAFGVRRERIYAMAKASQ